MEYLQKDMYDDDQDGFLYRHMIIIGINNNNSDVNKVGPKPKVKLPGP